MSDFYRLYYSFRSNLSLSRLASWLLMLVLVWSVVAYSARPSAVPITVETSGVGHTWNPSDTVHVLAIRVEFLQDDLTTTTGNGTFGSGFPDTMFVDPLPHDRSYFEDHLLFVKNYFDEVSNHHLVFGRMDVYPEDPNGAYQLPRYMWQYNYNYTPEVLDQQLADLFYDSWTAADSAGLFQTVDVNQFNAYVIFHAGVGKDFALGFDPTPFDIPSAYLDLEHLRNYLTIPASGIGVASGYIPNGLILPESEVQDNLELGLNGVMVKLFGNLLGIPDLYDTQTGRSGIGRWGMMDQGSGNYQALIPARPCPWTLADMGWVDPVVIYPGQPDTLEVASITVADTSFPKYYKIPLNDHEYFLLENRQANIVGQEYTTAWDRDGRQMRLYQDYHVEVESGFRVIVSVDDYDFDIPGSGILIWHIDEEVIAAHRADNTVNASRPYRGVDVEEADGAEDIGQEYDLFNAGYGQEYGSPWDCFYEGNEVHLESNHSIAVRFTDDTAPPARTNSGARSHLSFTNFSPVDTVMTFVVRHNFHQEGFPIVLEHGLSPNTELLVDLTGNGASEIVMLDTVGRLLAFRGDGSGLGVAGNGVLAELNPVSGDVDYSSASADLDGDGYAEIVVSRSDSTWFFTQTSPDQVEQIAGWGTGGGILIGGTATERLVFVASGGDILVGDADGTLRWGSQYPAGTITGIALCMEPDSGAVVAVYDQGVVVGVHYDVEQGYGSFIWNHELPLVNGTPIFNPVVGDLDGDGDGEAVVVTQHGFFVFDSAGFSGPFPSSIPVTLTTPPTLADLDRDGTLEIVIAGQDAIYAFHHNGALIEEFPIIDGSWLGDEGVFSPVLLADITGNGFSELLLSAHLGQLVAFDADGNKVNGFPLSMGISDGRTPILGQLDDDADPEIIVGTSVGFVHGWNLETGGDVESAEMAWSMWGHNSARTQLAPPSPHESPGPGGRTPSNWTYCWPNPSEGDESYIRVNLTYPAEIEIRIFDMAGELVDELRGQANPLAPIDIAWQLNAVESGVYFARVGAQSGSRSDVKIVKVAVIK